MSVTFCYHHPIHFHHTFSSFGSNHAKGKVIHHVVRGKIAPAQSHHHTIHIPHKIHHHKTHNNHHHKTHNNHHHKTHNNHHHKTHHHHHPKPVHNHTPVHKPTIAWQKAMEKEICNGVNKYRISKGLKPLKLDPKISAIARKHSADMAKHKVKFSHTGFNDRAKAIKKAIPSTHSWGENLAMNNMKNPAQVAIKGWIKSPGHEKNMVGNYSLTGIAVEKNKKGEYYFTQLFAK